MNSIRLLRPRVVRLSARSIAALAALGWAGAGISAPQCLLNDASKVCLDLSASPAESVQPSGLADTPTFVRYKAVLSNASLKSTRFVELRLSLAPATGFTAVSAPASIPCAINGSELVCTLDKLTAGEPIAIEATANAPEYEEDVTEYPDLVNTARFGWQGRTATSTNRVEVSAQSGATYVPPNQTVTLVTAPEEPNRTDQVSAADPLWAKMTPPPRAEGYFARIAIITDGPDFSPECVGGLFHASSGGPFVCRDMGTPSRWVFTELPDDAFTATSPVDFTIMWDTTLVPATQLPPVDDATTGLPPFAIFHNQTTVGVPYGPSRAFADVCQSPPVAPCLTSVERLDGIDGDWAASFLKGNDRSDMAIAMADPLAPLAALLDYLIRVADAGPIAIGPIMR